MDLPRRRVPVASERKLSTHYARTFTKRKELAYKDADRCVLPNTGSSTKEKKVISAKRERKRTSADE